jgi:AcrR family transcriptional regulator
MTFTLAAMSSRRERLRASTIEEIRSAALRRIAEHGATALSIRGVARDIGMSPAGLYRYYDGLDALLTDLITDAYTDLAVAVEDAVSIDGPADERFVAGAMAYRRWALLYPNRFLLIFGTPIPGYVAPEGGPTVAANRRMGEAFFEVAAEGWRRGEMSAPALRRDVAPGERALADEIGQLAPGFPAHLVPTLIGAWAHFHGLVTLEILNQLHWMYPHPEAFYRGEVERMVAGLTV